VAELAAANPAERYGLRSKGRIEAGADADLCLVDPTARWRVERSDVISKAAWSPYEGRVFEGRVVATYLRGTEIARDGHCHDLRSGRFVEGRGVAA
jgi:allantoinase